MRTQRGLASALIIIVLILAAIGVIFGRSTTIGEGNLDQRDATEASMRRINGALVNFASLNLRLPCPAAGASDAGTEDATSPFATCNSADGVVPWATLGIRRNEALDGWGRKISFRVFSGANGFTKVGGASMVNCNSSLGAPIDAALDGGGLCKGPVGSPPAGSAPPNTPAQFLTLPARSPMLVVQDQGTARNDTAYVLISHGESGNGAFADGTSGRTAQPAVAGKEYVNTQAAGEYWILARSAPGTLSSAPSHFDDVVSYMRIGELVLKARIDARNWSAYPLSATFSLPAVTAAVAARGGTLVGENTGQTALAMGGFLVTGTDSTSALLNLGIRTEDTITGIGVVGGGGGDLNSAFGERLRFQLGDGSQFQKMDIALNRFRVIGVVDERAEVSFWRGGDMLQSSIVTSWVVDPVVKPARCLYSLVPSAVFDRVDVRPLPPSCAGCQTTFSVVEIKACSEATAVCTTAVPNALDCPNRPPSAASTAAQDIAATTATLNGLAHDNGAATTVTFDYGTTCAYPSSVAASPGSLAAGAGKTAVTASITGLTCNTSYYFRTKAVSAGGTTTGNDAMFTTAACGSPTPIATTNPPTNIATTSATLNGTVDGNGANATVTFDYGTTNCYGLSTAATPGTVSAGIGATPVTVSLTGLACNTRYHYRVRAVSISGTTTASDQAFTTAPCP